MSYPRAKLDEKTIARLSEAKRPKILLFDLETSTAIGEYFDRNREYNITRVIQDSIIYTVSYKWLDEKTVHTISQWDGGYNPKKPDDWYVVEKLWGLLNKADVVVAHNGDCVSVDTPILKQDLTWVEAGKLREGDKLVGFDENKSKNRPRRIRGSTVIAHKVEKRLAMKVTFDNGDEVITTPEHPWLKLAPRGRDYRWCETRDLKIGQRVEKFLTPWKPDKSYEAGWLSGFISGEGTLKADGKTFTIDFCQRPTVVWEQALEFCERLGIKLAKPNVKVGGVGRGDTLYTYVLGGKWLNIELLGKLQIKRLINKINWDNVGSLKGQYTSTSTIVSIEDVGMQDMAIMTTSSATYFADGYPMHNSFDVKVSNTRFVAHGLKPPSPYRQIDTKKIAKKYFKFDSNKLDELGRFLKLGRKLETGGQGLWDACRDGEEKAWKLMARYNKQDVILLEQVYLRMRGFHKTHPNLSFFTRNGSMECTVCHSRNVKRDGIEYYRGAIAQRWQCNDCGKHYVGTKVPVEDKVTTYNY